MLDFYTCQRNQNKVQDKLKKPTEKAYKLVCTNVQGEKNENEIKTGSITPKVDIKINLLLGTYASFQTPPPALPAMAAF